jgi:hypothetical protein
MPDLIPKLLPNLREHRIGGLDLDAGFIYPRYEDQSILNVPSGVCRLLGIPCIGAGPLTPEITTFFEGDIDKVILILMDAMALHRLQRWMGDGSAPVWDRLARDGILAPLTSITPSTTSAALTSLWTGRSAAVHGIAGYEMWLKEYGVVANTIQHAPMSFKGDIGGLSRAGFEPDKFLNLPTLGTHLAGHGVRSYAFQHASIIKSGLSQMYFDEVKRRAFSSAADLWVNARELLESKPNERMYVYVYWPVVDTLSHYYGPDDERTVAEFASFSRSFEGLFLERLGPAARKNTILILTADHGCIATQPDPKFNLHNHPDLTRLLHIRPTGENRLVYLHVRPGQIKAVCDYVEHTWPYQFDIIESDCAVEVGLFGPGKPHAGLRDRLGDLILVARGDAYLWWAEKKNSLLGRHGGLHPDEMLVPFLGVRL